MAAATACLIADRVGSTWLICNRSGTHRSRPALFPVARQVTHGQAERLVQRIAREAQESHKPVKVVIRDPYFMAATVITLKRQSI